MISVKRLKVGSSATESRKPSRQRTSRQNRTPIFADLVSNCKPIFGVRRQSAVATALWTSGLTVRADPKHRRHRALPAHSKFSVRKSRKERLQLPYLSINAKLCRSAWRTFGRHWHPLLYQQQLPA